MKSAADYRCERELRHAVEGCLREAERAGVLPRSGRTLVVACSGGEDSHALLHVLCGLRERLNLSLTVCHIDHRLRAESAEDAAFVRGLCEKYGLPFRLVEASVRDEKENIEAWARRIRYEQLEKVRAESGAQAIVTAHHRNDQAETVLFRFLMGRILTSARAMREIDAGRRLLRPFLSAGKKSITEYLALYDLPHAIDATNLDFRRTRNRIRHELLPMLEEQYNPNLVEDLALAGLRFSRDEEYLWREAEMELDRRGPLLQPIAISELQSFAAAIRWRLYATVLRRSFGEDAGKVGYHAFAAVDALVERDILDGPKTVELGFGFTAHIHPGNGVGFSRES